MATSEVEICNSALFKLGDSPIQSLTETSKRARVCATMYPLKRDEMLMRYRWTFSLARATLAPLSAAPEFGYTYQFNLPSDCLSVIGLGDSREDLRNYTASKEAYKVEGRKLLYTANTAQIHYIAKQTDVSKFDPLFVEALALRMAMDMVYALSTGLSRVAQLERDWRDTMRSAKMANAIQAPPEIIEADEYLTARWSDLGTEEFLRAGPILT